MVANNKTITTVRIVDFIMPQQETKVYSKEYNDEEDSQSTKTSNHPIDNRKKLPTETNSKDEKTNQQKKDEDGKDSMNYGHKETTCGKLVKYRKVAGRRKAPQKIVITLLVALKRKEIITDSKDMSMFALVSLRINISLNEETKYPAADGGDVVKEFEPARKPHLESALKAKLENLK